ncbi:MAG: peroxide stress protein YaaA, partial [Arcobacteraceae bacterium]|nr:peroxide stress protein YaaA [Arcobacteraceae bacterium]
MKILLAPAETKLEGGDLPPLDLSKFILQKDVVTEYEKFISSSSIEELSKWFGLKNLELCKKYKRTIKELSTMKAIQRYTGVAFEAIKYNELSSKAQNYIDENVIIFSNYPLIRKQTLRLSEQQLQHLERCLPKTSLFQEKGPLIRDLLVIRKKANELQVQQPKTIFHA